MKKALLLLFVTISILPSHAHACSLASGGELSSIISSAGALLGKSVGGIMGKVNDLCNKVGAMEATMDRALSAIPVCSPTNKKCIAKNKDAYNAQRAMKLILSSVATTTANVKVIANSGASPAVVQAKINDQISNLESSISTYKSVLVSSLKNVGQPPPPAQPCTLLDVNTELANNSVLENPLPEETVRDIFKTQVGAYESCEEKVADEVYCCWY